MNVAVVTPYNEAYKQDCFFDVNSCKIGQNLLLPNLMLKKRMEELGHSIHTIDMFNIEEVDVILFYDLNNGSYYLIENLADFLKYILKGHWKDDYLAEYIKNKDRIKSVLIMQEPPVVFPKSYNFKYHKYFDKILTWNDDLVDNQKYFKFFYPQVVPDQDFNVSYSQKKNVVMMCGNKRGKKGESLYSLREEAIRYFENNISGFDLYGYGWEKSLHPSYRGSVDDKLTTLSNYKFCICFENMTNIKGYITEKIFDCFFAGCIPIYLGATNIDTYVSENTFIDFRKFGDFEKLKEYILSMKEEEYQVYMKSIKSYLKSEKFIQCFSLNSFLCRMERAIQG